MRKLENVETGTYLKFNAIKQNSKQEEITELYERLPGEHLNYLTGADIICDSGCIASGVSVFTR